MKTNLNQTAFSAYRELLGEDNRINLDHPVVLQMQKMSEKVPAKEPMAITRLEVQKECHRLADDLYQLTGSDAVFSQVQRIGNTLLTRLLENGEKPAGVNQ